MYLGQQSEISLVEQASSFLFVFECDRFTDFGYLLVNNNQTFWKSKKVNRQEGFIW